MKKIVVTSKEQPTEIFSTMGCRTCNGADINFKHSFEENINRIVNEEPLYDDMTSAAQKDGRGNICPSTIILPTLAMEAVEKVKSGKADGVVEEFMKILDKCIHETKDTLLERYKHICSQSPKAATFMYDNHTMAGYVPEEGIQSALRHGTLVIGQLGLSECLTILIGKDQTTDEGMELAKRIEMLYLERCNAFKKEYSLNFGVYLTPAENLCYTAFRKWKQKYGEMENVTYYYDKDGNKQDKLYFTNSIHVPVYDNVNIFEKIDIESKLSGYSNAGCITYVEMDASAQHNVDAMEDIVNYAMDHDIPYFALNFKLDRCDDCGHTGEFNGVCPVCGSENISELRRVTGYLSTTKKHFNMGKQVECDQRVEHVNQQIC